MNETTIQGNNFPGGPNRVFAFLVAFRWLSLIPPVLAYVLAEGDQLPLAILFIPLIVNLIVTVFSRPLIQQLLLRPWLLAVDLGLMAGLFAFGGGWYSPFYLYALSPMLMAAFLFYWRAEILVTGSLILCYLAGVLIATGQNGGGINWLLVIGATLGFALAGGVLGYASSLVMRLNDTHSGLVQTHRDLEIIHDLTLSLQSAADVEEVQDRVLDAVTTDLGFNRAVVGLVDQDRNIITSWLGRVRDGQTFPGGTLPHLMQLPLVAGKGPIAEAFLRQEPCRITELPDTVEARILTHFGMTSCRVFPMSLREHSVGVLLVDDSESEESSVLLPSLASIASQAAVAVGTTMMCIDRAQRMAVQEERLRIAQDIHDTVSQALFGIVYTLDGSLRLLPDQPEEVIPELKRALRVAEAAHREVRQSILNIWPSEMTSINFADGLQKYADDICRASDLQLDFQINGEFERLSALARRGLYRIAQEAIANAAHHALANQVKVTLEILDGQARLIVLDDGCGFDLAAALVREYDREHFGLRGMQERADSLAGRCEFHSQPGQGTAVVVDVPVPREHQ